MQTHIHTTKDGKKIPIRDLSTSHLQNIIRRIERLSKKGIDVISGSCGSCAEDMCADVDTLYGLDALSYLHYWDYIHELENRNEGE